MGPKWGARFGGGPKWGRFWGHFGGPKTARNQLNSGCSACLLHMYNMYLYSPYDIQYMYNNVLICVHTAEYVLWWVPHGVLGVVMAS